MGGAQSRSIDRRTDMKASALVCAALAGTLGFSTLASAQDRDGRRDDHPRAERRDDRREARDERRDDRQDWRQDRREQRAERQDRQEDRAYRQGWRAGDYHQPSYQYQQPRYYSQAPRFQRGGYLPYEYRQRGYYVNNWNAYPSLYAPPHGHQWMNVNGELLLVALATGLIANALMN
jgi:Ni/Co efflux regulator RcnB